MKANYEKKKEIINNPLYQWARREADLAVKDAEEKNKDGHGDVDYYRACLASALKAYASLIEDGHSGFSLEATKRLLNRFIEGKPFTPITEEDEFVTEPNISSEIEFCDRYKALNRMKNADGVYEYSDTNRVTYRVIDGKSFHNRRATEAIDELYPITFPYSADEKYIVVGREHYKDETRRDYDAMSLDYVILPDGTEAPIERYYIEKDRVFEMCTAEDFDQLFKEDR